MKPKDFPLNGCDLGRRILGRELRGREDFPFIQGQVRALLREYECPKTSDSPRANWVVDKEMAERVTREINRRAQAAR